MRVLAISSQVAWGPVGLTAAVPALQAKGHEVVAVPTITLSNHPGHGRPAGFRTAPDDLAAMLGALDGLGVLGRCDAVLTGYFAAPEQVETVRSVLVRMKQARPGLRLVVDPVIGDNGSLYVAQPIASAIRDGLLPLASCITPNAFELAWLSGLPVTDEAEAAAAARHLGLAEVLATSIPDGTDHLATLVVTPDATHRHHAARLTGVPHGTGDFLGGLYLAARLEHAPGAALADAMATLDHAIAISAGSPVLNVAGALRGA